ncbi:MAG: sulfatase-like hydrolase/transferase [Bacteroidota bacterium]
MTWRKSANRSKSGSSKGSGRGRSSGRGRGWFRGNIITVMLVKLLLVLLLLFLSRILFYLFNLGYFSNLGLMDAMRLFVIGIRFDLSAALIINAPFIFMNSVPFKFRYTRIWQGFANGYFYLINSFALMTNFGDTIYFRFTLKRLTFDFFKYMGVGGDFDKLIPQFLRDFWYVGVIWLLFVGILIFIGTHLVVDSSSTKKKGSDFKYLLINTFLFVLIMALSIIGIRGGLQLRPIGLVTAGNYTSAKNLPLVLNTPFSIARTINKVTLKTITIYKKEIELAKVYTPVHQFISTGFKGYNVMIIILESVSREHIGSLNRSLENGNYQGFTPFLDSLIRNGMYFDAFANGKTSIQGIPAILSGIPSLMNESFIQSSYAAGKFTSIAGLLKPKGYTTAFFHGGTNGTMAYDSYTRLVGFDHYFGRSEYNNEKDYDGKWGIRDEEFFQFTAKKINGFKQPFVAAFFSLSSHHPYHVPGRYVNIFRTGKLPIQQSIMYADYSLGKFFHTARHMPWYKNTLFVITADHTSEGYYPYYQSDVGQYAVPLLFFKPGSDLRGKSSLVAQQTDVMPTVLNYLGYDKKYLAFGTDLFDTTSNAVHFSIHYISGLYGLMKGGFYLEYNGTKSTALFNITNDPLQSNNLIGKENEVQARMELFIKAYIQQYNNRLIENRMTIDLLF